MRHAFIFLSFGGRPRAETGTVRSLSAAPARLGLMQTADYEQALEAVREWYEIHGRLPRPLEWEKAAPSVLEVRDRKSVV